MIGSTASFVTKLAPDIVRSVQGETSQAQAGSFSPVSINRPIKASASPPPALSPPRAMRGPSIPFSLRKRRHSAHLRELLETDVRETGDTQSRASSLWLRGLP